MTDYEMTEAEANAWWAAECKRVAVLDDVQEFEQVHRVGGFFTKVWYRPLGFDFMAETTIEVGKGRRRLTAVAWTRAGALERLAAHALEYQHPSGDFRTKAQANMHFNRHQGEVQGEH